jgi:hypothetical protein
MPPHAMVNRGSMRVQIVDYALLFPEMADSPMFRPGRSRT